MSQAKYAYDLVSQVGLTDDKTTPSLLEANAKFSSTDGSLLKDATLHCQLVGSLVCLTVTRPDIANAIHFISQFMGAPRTTHYVVVLRLLHYIKGTLFLGIHSHFVSQVIL